MSTEMRHYPPALWKPVPNFGYPLGTHGQLKANGPKGGFFHDAQGWRDGALATFCDPRRGSAHAIINLDGPPWQFVDFDDAAWHAGGYMPGMGEFSNLFYWGIEFEGGYPTPTLITDYQIDQAVALCRWLASEYDFVWAATRRVDLWEHREVYPTSCPSDRIRWPEIIAGLKEQDMDANQLAQELGFTDAADLKAHLERTRWLAGWANQLRDLLGLAADYRTAPDQDVGPERKRWLPLSIEVAKRARDWPELRPQ